MIIMNTLRDETPLSMSSTVVPIHELSELLFSAGHLMRFYDLPYGTIEERQMTSGCTQEKYLMTCTSSVITFGQNSPNLTLKKEGKLVKLTKKFKPIIKHKKYTRDEMTAIGCLLMPSNFVRTVINGDNNLHEMKLGRTVRQTGFIYASPEGVLTVGDNIDNSVSFSVARACHISDTTIAKKMIDAKWSFDDIAAHLAYIVGI